jgi:hypothetical protein
MILLSLLCLFYLIFCFFLFPACLHHDWAHQAMVDWWGDQEPVIAVFSWAVRRVVTWDTPLNTPYFYLSPQPTWPLRTVRTEEECGEQSPPPTKGNTSWSTV